MVCVSRFDYLVMNRTFLDEVAADMLHKLGNDLSRTVVIFPNKRARLFFAESLYRSTRHALWSPSYLTISELFHSYTSLAVTDEIKLVTELHRSYRICTGSEETLDHFYGWGQVMLNDFDDIDKNLANVHDVFRNVKDLHELDDMSYLSESQKQILKRFFSTFSDKNETELKKRFLKLWNNIEDIYNNYNLRLRQQGIAYEGMLYREVAERNNLSLDHDIYIFVGFNLLQKVEQSVFSAIMREGKAKFYWDFDRYYLNSNNNVANEAGIYIKQFLQMFPNELDYCNKNIYDNFNNNKEISLIQ